MVMELVEECELPGHTHWIDLRRQLSQSCLPTAQKNSRTLWIDLRRHHVAKAASRQHWWIVEPESPKNGLENNESNHRFLCLWGEKFLVRTCLPDCKQTLPFKSVLSSGHDFLLGVAKTCNGSQADIRWVEDYSLHEKLIHLTAFLQMQVLYRILSCKARRK